MADSDGSLPVSREELGLEPLEDNQEEEQETSSSGDEGSPSPQQDQGGEGSQQEDQQGNQQGGEDPDPDDPSGGSSKDDEGSHPSSGGSGNPSDQGGGASRHSGSPLGSLSAGVTNPILRQKFEAMEARAKSQAATIAAMQSQVAVLVANAQVVPPQPQVVRSAFQGVKLRPKDPPLFSGEDKQMPIKDWLATVTEWLDTGSCDPDRRVPMAQTFLSKGASSYWRARVQALKSQNVDIDFAQFAKTLEAGFGHQDPEQNARDKLEALTQTGTVEDYASKFQSLSAEIVTLSRRRGSAP